MLIMRLLAPVSMPDDRIALTNGTLPQNNIGALFGPVGFELVRRRRKWDKDNRSSSGSAPALTLPRSEPEAEPLLPKDKIQLEENNASGLRLLEGCDSKDWPVNCHSY
jgi:hypothetical protein